MIAPLTLIALVVLAYAVFSRRLASTIVTAPVFFAAVGLLVGPVLGLVELPAHDRLTVGLLEAALVMVLFADASSLDIRRWTREPSLSGRLLGIGLPLTMLAGAALAWVLVPGIQVWQAALVGVILAPTDAALGQAVVTNPRVPTVVRNALNVESGLNDGLSLPFVTIFIAAGVVAAGGESQAGALRTLALALGGSTAVGLVAGLGGGWLVRVAAGRDIGESRWLPIAMAALAVAAFSVADEMGASGFLAVWVAGLAAGYMVREHVKDGAFDLPEQLADVLAAVGFLLLGATLIRPVLEHATPLMFLYAVLSLTVVRMIPVVIAMVGTGLAPISLVFIGWFGPRGLASIVFASVVVEAAVPNSSEITDVVLLTVVVSMVVHGVTAAWGAGRYGAWFRRAAEMNPAMPEAVEPSAPVLRGSRRLGIVDPDRPA